MMTGGSGADGMADAIPVLHSREMKKQYDYDCINDFLISIIVYEMRKLPSEAVPINAYVHYAVSP